MAAYVPLCGGRGGSGEADPDRRSTRSARPAPWRWPGVARRRCPSRRRRYARVRPADADVVPCHRGRATPPRSRTVHRAPGSRRGRRREVSWPSAARWGGGTQASPAKASAAAATAVLGRSFCCSMVASSSLLGPASPRSTRAIRWSCVDTSGRAWEGRRRRSQGARIVVEVGERDQRAARAFGHVRRLQGLKQVAVVRRRGRRPSG